MNMCILNMDKFEIQTVFHEFGCTKIEVSI